MALHLYNTFTKKEEEFTPLKEGEVTMYSCGPTVYGRPHIGNYSSFLLADLLRRWFEVGHNLKVTHVKNITDVGHLTGDDTADADGVDKIEGQVGREGLEGAEGVMAIVKKYSDQYIADEKAMNFREPEHRPRATETIDEMIAMTQKLIDKGHAYETEDGVYFDVTSFADYGKLSGNTLENLCTGARVAVDERKKHPADFALWKKCVGENANHILRWESPWGEGFPGWHIECSCMSEKFLGSQFDVHTGGEDLIFPHHECEIAQSVCSGDGKTQHVRYWLHKRFIDMGDTKMSKSLGNVLTLPDIEAMGYSPLDLRYYLLSVHYRTNLKFTEKGLSDAHKARRKIVEWIGEVESAREAGESGDSGEWKQKFSRAMDSDLNTPAALAVVFDAMAWSRTEGSLGACAELVHIIKETFGCFEEESRDIPQEVLDLAAKREQARADKDFAASDQLRDELYALGYEVKDTSEGQKVTKL